MARTTVLPMATYPAGTRVAGPANINNNVSHLTVEVSRCTSSDPTVWSSETARLYQVWEQSNDGGDTWQQIFIAEDWGGITVNQKTGIENPLAWFNIVLQPGTSRRLRATLTLDEPIKTQVAIDVV